MADALTRSRFAHQSQVAHANHSSSDSEDDYSTSEISESSENDEPGWQEEALKSGELFYVESNEESKMFNSNRNSSLKSSPQSDANKQIYKNAKPMPSPLSSYKKQVYVTVKRASAYDQTPPVTLLASMLGIIVLEGQAKPAKSNCINKDIIEVDALVPGGTAILTDLINIGDILIAVDDFFVNLKNINDVLSKITKPSSIKLTFKVFEKLPYPDDKLKSIKPNTNTHPEEYHCAVTLLTPHSSRQNKVYCLSGLHAVFYLTLNVRSETAAEFDDLLYSFPSVEAAIALSKLAQIRGLFLTLSDLIEDSFRSRVLSSSLIVGDDMVHCTFYQVKTEVFVLCLPSKNYTLYQAHSTMSNAVRLLSIMFSNLKAAFQPENKQRLDHMFHYLLFLNATDISSSNPLIRNGYFENLGVKSRTLPLNLKCKADSALAELESSDFDLGTKTLNYSRRLYTVQGSCLFFDGCLVANHLSKDDLFDVHLFCFNHNLLSVREKDRIGLLVIWREIFRSCLRFPNGTDNFPISAGRHFLLIVGFKRSLLCTLLQLNGKLFPSSHTPRPDTAFVDNVKAILLNLDSNHFYKSLDHFITSSLPLKLASADNVSSTLNKSLFSTTKPPSGEARQSGNKLKLRIQSPLRFKSATSDSDDGKKISPKKSKQDDKGNSSRASRSLFRDKSFSSQESMENFNTAKASSREDVNEAMSALAIDQNNSAIAITTGDNGTLFSFMKFDTIHGILLKPFDYENRLIGGKAHHEIVENFRKHALLLHQRLACRNENANHCIEEGILFQYQPEDEHNESKKKRLQYWVIGRKMKKPQPYEFYVCFHNSVPQSMVEMAFQSSKCLF